MEIQGKRFRILNLFVFIGLLFVFFNCSGRANSSATKATDSVSHLVVNELDTLKKQFNQFKKSVIEGRKSDVKVFFDFPIKSDDLWYKVLDDNEVESKLGDSFSEENFEIYFDNVFNEDFKKCLSDIDVQQLFDSGEFSTKPFSSKENDNFVRIQMEITYSDRELRLVLNSIVDNENDFNAEHTEIYIFDVIANRLKFRSFYMAD